MQKPILILMARWPAASRCKKRLSKSIGSFQAAAIQKYLTFHTISVAKKLKNKGLIEFTVAIDGIGPKRASKWAKEIGIEAISIQSPGDLGLKLRREIIKAQISQKIIRQRAKSSTILIGSDLPSLCELDIVKAIQKLQNNDLVIGPADDGGYWLIGVNAKLVKPGNSLLFDGIKWGSNSVLKETISKAKVKGIQYELLSYKNDLDHLEDLAPWYETHKSQN